MPCKCDESVGYLCDAHAVERVRPKVIQWMRERYENCVHFAAQTTGNERDGWMEDSAYFILAIKMLEDSDEVQGREGRGDRRGMWR